ncbi:DUF2726 domain-containing protein [Planococcus kocurii]|uniref:DUF2726 domain-containing protein n=1 Tax=Planococcus kocurii TaxID=1374 RepID=UPI003CFC832C
MEFKGKIIFIIKDQYDCFHLYKKKAQSSNPLEKYIYYVLSLEKQEGKKLIKSLILKDELNCKEYVWSSENWRSNLNERISSNHQKYLDFLAQNRKDTRFIGPYKSKKTKGLHLCIYGHEWSTTPLKVMEGESCPNCKKNYRESQGAKYITKLLVDNDVEFIKEVSLSKFGFENTLRLDFLICQNNIPLFVVEYNGIQHYKPLRSAFFGGFKGFKERKSRDRLKRKSCWNVGLPVIDIPYTESEENIKKDFSLLSSTI